MYIPKNAVTQAARSNKGVLSTNKIIELDNENKFTKGGQLELIETDTLSGASACELTNLPVTEYDIFYVTFDMHTGSHDVGVYGRFGHGGTFEESNYYYAVRTGFAGVSNVSYSSSSMWAMQLANLGTMASSPDGLAFTGHCYLYDMGDSTKYSMMNMHSSFMTRTSNIGAYAKGGGCYPTAKFHNSFRIFPNTGNFSGNVSIYGVRNYT